MLRNDKLDSEIGTAPFKALVPNSSCRFEAQLTPQPDKKEPGVLFYYRGFHFVLLPASDGFQAALIQNGKPVLIEWNGRNVWKTRSCAKTMAKQHIKIHVAPF